MNRPESYRKYNHVTIRDNVFTLDNYLHLIRWKQNPKVLDLGSGDGWTTMEILEPRLPRDYVKLVGSDLEEKMVEYANKSNTKLKIEFVQFDISGDKILSEKFDHIFSFFAIHWVKDLRRACQNMYDLLSPGGSVLTSIVVNHGYHDVLKCLADHPTWGSYYQGQLPPIIISGIKSGKLLKTNLELSGFVDCKMEIVERHSFYSDWTKVLNMFLSLDPIISKLNDDLKIEYIVDYVTTFKEIFKECQLEDGQIRTTYDLLIVYAFKPE